MEICSHLLDAVGCQTLLQGEANGMSEQSSTMNPSSTNLQKYCVEDTKELLDDIVSRLSAIGIAVHVIKDRVVLSEDDVGDTFAIVDGGGALKFVNEPTFADKLLCVGLERFYCHSEYVAIRSEYFRVLFRGDFQESSMDVVSVVLPAPGNFEPVLRFLYSGLADAVLLSEGEIFRTIQNSIFLGIDSLLNTTAEAFAQNWKVLAKSPQFRQSVVPFEFVLSVLEVGLKQNLFRDGETLRFVSQWNEENVDPLAFPETNRLLSAGKCFQTAGIADLEWALEVNEKLFASLGHTELRPVYRRASQDLDRANEKVRATELKIKGLMQYVKTLSNKLEEVTCNRCGEAVPRAALKSRTCVSSQHKGDYVVNRGWSCCGELMKRSRGCKPVSVSRHRLGPRN